MPESEEKTPFFYSWIAETLFELSRYDVQVHMYNSTEIVWFPQEGICRLFDESALDYVLEQPGFAGSKFAEACAEVRRRADDLPSHDQGWSPNSQPPPGSAWDRFSTACGQAYRVLLEDPNLVVLIERSRQDNPDVTREPERYWAEQMGS